MGEILNKYPQLEVTSLLRKPTSEFKDRYPNVKIVTGSFDDFEIIEKAAHDCDIMIRELPMGRPLKLAATYTDKPLKTPETSTTQAAPKQSYPA